METGVINGLFRDPSIQTIPTFDPKVYKGNTGIDFGDGVGTTVELSGSIPLLPTYRP